MRKYFEQWFGKQTYGDGGSGQVFVQSVQCRLADPADAGDRCPDRRSVWTQMERCVRIPKKKVPINRDFFAAGDGNRIIFQMHRMVKFWAILRLRIICTRNMSKIKNGTYARIIRLNAKSIRVIKNTGEKVTIKMDKEHGLLVCIGYAITVHRSQGVTLDEVNVIADGMFECGQLYVALTRCKSREGMRIIGKIKPEHICANEEAIAWMSETIQNKEPER